MKKSFLRKMAAFVLLAVVTMAMTACGSKEVDLSDYVYIEYAGYSGNGRVRMCLLNPETVVPYIEKAINYTERAQELNSTELAGTGMEYPERFEDLIHIVAVEGQTYSNLSNGDTVVFGIRLDGAGIEQFEADFECEFKDTIEIKVKDLAEPELIDMMAAYKDKISFRGPDGEGRMVHEYMDDDEIIMQGDNFTVYYSILYYPFPGFKVQYEGPDRTRYVSFGLETENLNGLSNGDVITVNINDGEALAELWEAGIAVETSMELKVSGLGRKVVYPDPITKTMKAEMDTNENTYFWGKSRETGEWKLIKTYRIPGYYSDYCVNEVSLTVYDDNSIDVTYDDLGYEEFIYDNLIKKMSAKYELVPITEFVDG